MALYEIAILGEPTAVQRRQLREGIAAALEHFQLRLGIEVEIHDNPKQFKPSQRTCAVAVYFGHAAAHRDDVSSILDLRLITVLPLVSAAASVAEELPLQLRPFNCLSLDKQNMDRVVTAVLECIGLLRRQRKVFLSYRREEATEAALQLFAALSSRGFDVFLDTHGVQTAVDFQETLWHRLCDVDVMIMLDTKTYFDSRWTSEEFGRAMAKQIGVLRVQWPDATPDKRTQTCSRVELVAEEINATGVLKQEAVARIADQLEMFRSLSLAVRRLNFLSKLQAEVEAMSGEVLGVGPHFSTRISLPGNKTLTVQPVLGIPDATTAQEAIDRACGDRAAVLFDPVGMRRSWIAHLEWLERTIQEARWIRLTHAAWDLAGL